MSADKSMPLTTKSSNDSASKVPPSNLRKIVIVEDDWSEPQSTSANSIISTSSSSLNSTTSSAGSISSSDPLLVKSLVCDFFESQFSLKGESCELLSLQTSPSNDITGNIPASKEFQEVAAALRELGQQYARLYEVRIHVAIESFQEHVQRENVAQSFEDLSREIFVEGINWHYILTYFVFSAEVAQYARRSGLATVDDVAGWLIDYTDAHLSNWIKQNGGWIGFRKFFVEKGFLSDDNSKIDSNSNRSKMLLLFGTAATALVLGCYLKASWNRP